MPPMAATAEFSDRETVTVTVPPPVAAVVYRLASGAARIWPTRASCASAAASARRAASTLRFATVHVPTPMPTAITPAATDTAANRRQRCADAAALPRLALPRAALPGGACGVRATACSTDARSAGGG